MDLFWNCVTSNRIICEFIRLHSHEIKFNPHSDRFSVTCIESKDDPNSFWLTKSGGGTPIANYGMIIMRQTLQSDVMTPFRSNTAQLNATFAWITLEQCSQAIQKSAVWIKTRQQMKMIPLWLNVTHNRKDQWSLEGLVSYWRMLK